MSDSSKLPIMQDDKYKRYHRAIRRSIKQSLASQIINTDTEEITLKQFQEIVNDYDWRDWKWDYRIPYHSQSELKVVNNQEWKKKASRK